MAPNPVQRRYNAPGCREGDESTRGLLPLASNPGAVASATPRRQVVREARPVVGRDDLIRLLLRFPGTASFQTSSAFVPEGSSKR
jgi:hypothetical protein